MSSDSESQDSDDGRRFRFATTRKDVCPLPLRKSPVPCTKRSKSRSRSRDRKASSREDNHHSHHSHHHHDSKRSNHSRSTTDGSSLKTTSREKSRDRKSEREKKETKRSSKEDHGDSRSKHKSKSKHKKRSRERSRERSHHHSSKKLKKHSESRKSEKQTKPEVDSKNGTKKSKTDENTRRSSSEEVSSSSNKSIGAVIPIKFLKDNSEEADREIGPVIPKHMARNAVIGPTLPVNPIPIQEVIEDDPPFSGSDSDDAFGPLPADHPALRDNQAQVQLENRAKRLLCEFSNKPEKKKNQREEWMIELPPVHAVALGLGPRKFKTKEGPDMSDRTIWTDTPEDRLRKQREKEENRFVKSDSTSKVSKRTIEVETNDHEKDRPESLLDMHLKTLKKKKKKLEKEAKMLGLSTRRPFNRDVDLQVNRLDDARKKSILKKASLLNDRFTSSKY